MRRDSHATWIVNRGFSALLLVGACGAEVANAANLSNFPGGTAGVVTGFGNDPPHATYFAQIFFASSETLNRVVFPVLGPGALRVLITETDGMRPSNVLFESDDISLPRNSTWYGEDQRPVFFFSDQTTGFGDAAWLNVKTGNRGTDFMSPVRTDPNQSNVWTFESNHSGFSACLDFAGDSEACVGQQLITQELLDHEFIADEIAIDVGGLGLSPGLAYMIVWDGASVAVVPEPTTVTLMMLAAAGRCFRRRCAM